MNLYLLERPTKADWDEYEGAVVAAETQDEARHIHPSASDYEGNFKGDCCGWVQPEQVLVKLIGVAAPSTPKGVIIASFNAG